MNAGTVAPAMFEQETEEPVGAGGVEARRILVEEARRAIARTCQGAARALVLTGSFARGEATVLRQAGELRVLGDAEFMLVLEKGARLSSDIETAVPREIAASALARGLRCAVDVAVVHADFFGNLPPHVFTYELRACGEVVWGDHAVLALIPPFTADDIDREDAWRLLGNRLVEQLEAVEDAPAGAESAIPLSVQYHTIKLVLDMATSLLVFTGDYAPTYRQRAGQLCRLASRTPSGMPFPLQEFASRVMDCTRWKLRAGGAPPPGWEFWQDAREYARRLWRWELQQLTGLGQVLDERILMERWMNAQPYRARVRGWLSAGRRCGGLKGWRRWPRFLRLAARSSPRYLVYAAAVELLFAPPPHGAEGAEGRSTNRLAPTGPLPLMAPGSGEGTRALAAEIVRNYRQLLVGTRA